MSQQLPFVITISRQLGSGGTYLGRRLANRLKIMYADREILDEAARSLEVPIEALESRDETLTSAWNSLLLSFAYGAPEMAYVPPPSPIPTDRELFTAESEIIRRIAETNSAVIVGRGGFYTLRDHPRHISIFFHADLVFRKQRVQELYKVSEREATRMIASTDGMRARYVHALTGCEWTDARQRDLCLDTGSLGLETAEEVIMTAVRHKFGGLEPQATSD